MKKLLISALLLAALPFAAQANDDLLNYTYVEGGYKGVNADGGLDSDGAYIKGSYDFGDSGFYAFGEFGYQDTNAVNFDYHTYDVGVGYHYGLSERVDLVGEVAAIGFDGDFGVDGDGYRLGLGVKAALTDNLEGLAQVNYRDGDDFADDTSALLGLRYAFNDSWSINGQVEFADDANTFGLGARYSF